MSVYFILELIIFVMMGSINDTCYFVLVMFVMMRSISDVCLLCFMFLLYHIYKEIYNFYLY